MGYSMIDIRNLLWHTVSKWRAMIVGALIGAIVIGAIGALITLPTEKIDVTEAQAQIDLYNLEIAELVEEQAQLNQYMAESLYMQIDYLTVTYTTFAMHVSPTDTSVVGADVQISELINTYTENVKSQVLYQRISDEMGYSMNYTEQMFEADTDGNGGFITFSLQSNSQADNEVTADIIIKYMEEIYPDLNATMYAHTLSIGAFNSTLIAAEEINSNNKEKQEELATVNEDISWRQGEIASMSQQIADQGITTAKLIKCVIFAILGIILGGICGAGYAFMYPIVKAQVQGAVYIEEAQDLNVLATAPLFSTSKNIIDNLIYKLSSRGPIKTEEEFLAYLALSINVNTTEGESIHVTGTIESKAIAELCSKIQEQVHAKLTYGGAVTEEVDSLGKMSEADGVILVEKRFCTRGSDLGREVQYIRKLDKTIKGAILL